MRVNPYFQDFTIDQEAEEKYCNYIVSNFQRKILAEFRFGIASMQAEHTKNVVNLMDFIGDLGGVANLLFVIAFFFLAPIA